MNNQRNKWDSQEKQPRNSTLVWRATWFFFLSDGQKVWVAVRSFAAELTRSIQVSHGRQNSRPCRPPGRVTVRKKTEKRLFYGIFVHTGHSFAFVTNWEGELPKVSVGVCSVKNECHFMTSLWNGTCGGSSLYPDWIRRKILWSIHSQTSVIPRVKCPLSLVKRSNRAMRGPAGSAIFPGDLVIISALPVVVGSLSIQFLACRIVLSCSVRFVAKWRCCTTVKAQRILQRLSREKNRRLPIDLRVKIIRANLG